MEQGRLSEEITTHCSHKKHATFSDRPTSIRDSIKFTFFSGSYKEEGEKLHRIIVKNHQLAQRYI